MVTGTKPQACTFGLARSKGRLHRKAFPFFRVCVSKLRKLVSGSLPNEVQLDLTTTWPNSRRLFGRLARNVWSLRAIAAQLRPPKAESQCATFEVAFARWRSRSSLGLLIDLKGSRVEGNSSSVRIHVTVFLVTNREASVNIVTSNTCLGRAPIMGVILMCFFLAGEW